MAKPTRSRDKRLKVNKISKDDKKIKREMLNLPKMLKGQRKILVQGVHAGMFDKDDRHVTERYKVKQTKQKDGKIILELTPHKVMQDRRKALVEKISKALEGSFTKKDLLVDVLEDVSMIDLEKLDTALDRGATVKGKPGCFFIRIKDPRKKKPYKIGLRN